MKERMSRWSIVVPGSFWDSH